MNDLSAPASSSLPRSNDYNMDGWPDGPPMGLPEYVTKTYKKLALPLELINSLISFSDWAKEGAEFLCSYAKHLGVAHYQLKEYLRQEEVLLRAEAPEIFSLGEEILNTTFRLSATLSFYQHSLSPLFTESSEGQHKEMSAKFAAMISNSLYRALGQIPDPPIRTLLERLRIAVCKWAVVLRDKVNDSTSPPTSNLPAWIHEHFRQKQHKLLTILWGEQNVAASKLTVDLGYTEKGTALNNLHRRVTETNKGLAEKVEVIGEQWEIGQRTRDGVLYYYLRRVTR